MNEKELLIGFSHIDETYIEDARQVKKPWLRMVIIRWTSIAAVIAMIFAMLSSGGNVAPLVNAEDLMVGITGRPVNAVPLKTNSPKVTDFAVRLMREANAAGENTLISPVSVLYALSMTANGAEGETLAQMEAVLGIPIDELNQWLYSYAQTINENQFKLANSIWFTNNECFAVNQDFLQTNADYYGADLYMTPFDDGTLQAINRWVKQNTDGMIPEILDEIPDEAVMYLINALCFDAKWEKRYEQDRIRTGTFTREDGIEVQVDFLYSTENRFLKDEMATGFIKYYEGQQYAFVGILPNQGVTVDEYLDSLTGGGLANLLGSARILDVDVAIPKFETAYSTELSGVLKDMGMNWAFDEVNAEFESLGTWPGENIYISRVLHKTFITVDEEGTRAGAATVVEGTRFTSVVENRKLYLDRPFVYMLIDVETGVPLFIGTMMDPTK